MSIAILVAVFGGVFVVIFVPLFQRITLAREKKENDKNKDS